MRLIKVKFKDFRRFAGEVSLDVNEDLIALVGPNEAGKSSILRAIDLLGRLELPSDADATRGNSSPAKVSALFALEPDDRALLVGIHDGDKVTGVWINLEGGRERETWAPEPWPHRDMTPRQHCQGVIETLEGDPRLDAAYSTSDELRWEPQRYVDVKTLLAMGSETLSAEEITSLEDLAHRLQQIGSASPDAPSDDDETQLATEQDGRSASREMASKELLDLANHERQPLPVHQVINALAGRTPDVAFFHEADRELQSAYNLEEVSGGPPPALANLCSLAELDLASIRDDIANGRAPHVEAVFEAANVRLRERFRATWSQSDVYPRLSTPLDGVMRVMIAVEGGSDYSFPEERSDGLRWFMALHAFLAARRDPTCLHTIARPE